MNNKMKYAVLLGDGMADLPVEALGGKTPIEYSPTPNMDSVAQNGICGMVRTVPKGMNPGSDTANLAVFGYDPEIYYTGRAPLEALNMNIQMGPADAAFRCNIVNAEGGIMNDFAGGHIDSRFAEIVIKQAAASLNIPGIEFYPGVSYRHIIIWRNYPYSDLPETTPPHDISDREVKAYLPKGSGSDMLNRIMEASKEIIASSPEIKAAGEKYKGKPESFWIWGGGKKPAMDTLQEKFGLTGYTISAVDLINGIGRAAGLEPVAVEGATGYLDTNYEGKVSALLDCMEKADYVYLHVEAPDESGHEGNLEHKLQAVRDFDSRVVGPVLEGMKKYEHYAVLVMPDHPTPLKIKTHSDAPVPFCMYRSDGWNSEELKKASAPAYGETAGASTGLFIPRGHDLLELMIKGKI